MIMQVYIRLDEDSYFLQCSFSPCYRTAMFFWMCPVQRILSVQPGDQVLPGREARNPADEGSDGRVAVRVGFRHHLLQTWHHRREKSGLRGSPKGSQEQVISGGSPTASSFSSSIRFFLKIHV